MYMKVVTGEVVRHLCAMDQFSNDSKTLCGCTVTQSQSWKRIGALEGDECPQCAERAFNGHRPHGPEDLERSD